MTITSHTKPAAQVRAILADEGRAGELLALWERLAGLDKTPGSDGLLLPAAVLMLGADQPSPAAALSVAQGLAGQPAGLALGRLGEALALLAGSRSLTPAYEPIVSGAIRAVARQLLTPVRSSVEDITL
jgi:hypothetical protein